MYQDCISSLTVDADDDVPDDDPPIIRDAGFHHVGWPPPATTTAPPFTPDFPSSSNTDRLAGDESINRLAHELDEQASLSDRRLWRISHERGTDGLVANSSSPRAQDAILATPAPGPQMELDPEKSGMPPRQRAGSQLDTPISGMDPCSAESDRPRSQTESRVQHNHCREDLLTTMVEHNVQCNVQGSGLLSEPPGPKHRASYQKFQWFGELGDSGNDSRRDSGGLTSFDYMMGLEVDRNYCEGDDEALLHDTVALRQAGTPAGIRRKATSSNLRYRTSADVGAQCRNLKRNVPRMRRRPKAKPPAPPAAPAGARSTTVQD